MAAATEWPPAPNCLPRVMMRGFVFIRLFYFTAQDVRIVSVIQAVKFAYKGYKEDNCKYAGKEIG